MNQEMNQEMNQGFYNPELVVDHTFVEAYELNAYMAKVFGWMFYGLLVTALTTAALVFGINNSPAIGEAVLAVLHMPWIILLFQFGLVWFISARVHQMQPFTAKILYTIYAMSVGLTIGILVYLLAEYVLGFNTVIATFAVTSLSFGAMAVYGLATKRDLTRIHSLLGVALFGIIIAAIANWFVGSGMLDFIVLYGGLLVFLGIVAARTNLIKSQYAQVAMYNRQEDGTVSYEGQMLLDNLAIHGALGLYLAFVNIFLRILMIMGRAKGGGGRR